jgi:glycosyltransferase involved in cell wall biosynthesis
MTLLSTLGLQTRKRKVLISPTSIGFSDISVIIPVKDNQKGVKLFLSEFLKTHPPAWFPREIIIVDNNSKPPVSIPKEYVHDGLNITVLRCSSPGPACARNLGIQYAQAEWVLFTDSDCIPSPSFLLGYFQAMNGSVGYDGTVKAWGEGSPLSLL